MTLSIRNYLSGDEIAQAAVYNCAAARFPGFTPVSADELRRQFRRRDFDPGSRFYAEADGEVVGFCTLETRCGLVGYPWCLPGFESAALLLFESVLCSARDRGLTRLVAACRRDWPEVIAFFEANGFVRTREMVNLWADPVDLPTEVNRYRLPIDRLRRDDLPAVAELGRGIVRLPPDRLESYFFANPDFPAEAVFVLRDQDRQTPVAVGVAIENPAYPDVRTLDPLAPGFRAGAFGTEGLPTQRVNGLFSFLVADPARTPTAGLALLTEACREMTEGSVAAVAAQCPSDVVHLSEFYRRYFREQGRFPVLERSLG